MEHEEYMRQALELARLAMAEGEMQIYITFQCDRTC